MSRDPFCNNCGYTLRGLTESSKCPECGRPLVEVLERPGTAQQGRRYTSDIRIFGLPLVQIALGPHENERMGYARGIIAIGDRATGWLALGGFTCGLIAAGGMSIGVVAIGGASVGVVGVGGMVLGLLCAFGGLAAGGTAVGGLAAGYVVVSAGLAFAVYARSGQAFAYHSIGGGGVDQTAVDFFNEYAWLFGANASGGKFLAWLGLAIFLWIVLLFLIALAGYSISSKVTAQDQSQMR